MTTKTFSTTLATIYGGLLLLTLSGCSDIFLEDLSDKKVTILAPIDSLHTTQQTVTFWWEPLEGASSYHLQIVSPSFDTLLQFVTDTFITGDRFISQLNSNKRYEWRIIAVNDGSTSLSEIRKLYVVRDTSLVNQIILLQSPANNAYMNSLPVVLQWSALDLGNRYQVQVATSAYFNSNDIVYNQDTITQDNVELSLSEGSYYWRVRATDGITNSEYSSPARLFTLDISAPIRPILITPIASDTLQSYPSTFSWSAESNSQSNIEFAIDSNVVVTSFSTSTAQTYSFTTANRTTLGTGWRYWRVKSEDAANNTSRSFWRRLFLQ